MASSNSKVAEMNVVNTSNPIIPPPPVLKEVIFIFKINF
jgi:hypothetical protein